jgi:low molecular weight protein-tyrosine phosphatase
MNYKEINSVLFVCMGNICRSPSAEAVFRYRANQQKIALTIDSAGTIAAHAGENPDQRSQKAGIKRGYSFTGITARQVTLADFEEFDLILAMDNDNLLKLKQLAPTVQHHKIALFLSFAKDTQLLEVPDPYYGGNDGFEQVLDLVEAASDGLLKKLSF